MRSVARLRELVSVLKEMIAGDEQDLRTRPPADPGRVPLQRRMETARAGIARLEAQIKAVSLERASSPPTTMGIRR